MLHIRTYFPVCYISRHLDEYVTRGTMDLDQVKTAALIGAGIVFGIVGLSFLLHTIL